MIGDFNIHMDDPLDGDTKLFNDFLDAFNLTNKVDFPTQIRPSTRFDPHLEGISNCTFNFTGSSAGRP